jgi:site-specific DNA-methyltransferase (adenine-specific)/modification methylase
VIGSYHNIFRVGAIMMELGFWILNDCVWEKVNPMPNFRGTRFTNSTETLIWAKKSQAQKRYTFNYHAMKAMNDDKQMTNVWQIPLCTGAERIKVDGKKAHSTQKPEALLYRVLLASSDPGDLVLDPFFGSGTTGAVAKKLGRHYLGFERDPTYVEVARARIAAISGAPADAALLRTPSKRTAPRVAFGALVAAGYIAIGAALTSPDGAHTAVVQADGSLVLEDGRRGSIHKLAALLLEQANHNGWEYWHLVGEDGGRVVIDMIRERYRG